MSPSLGHSTNAAYYLIGRQRRERWAKERRKTLDGVISHADMLNNPRYNISMAADFIRSTGLIGQFQGIKVRINNKGSVGHMVKKRDMATTTRPRRCRVHTSSIANTYEVTGSQGSRE